MDEEHLFLLENSYLKWQVLQVKNGINEINLTRQNEGEFYTLYEQLRMQPQKFFEYLRMSIDTFNYILENIENCLLKKNTNFRRSIPPIEKLFITLRFLSTGLGFRSLAFSFRMGKSTIAEIVYDTCDAIWKCLLSQHMPKPTEQQLKRNVHDYENMWKFPNCFGCVDGKHFRIKCPEQSGSAYYNYKKFYSVVLQAVVDAKKRFIVIEVGGKGKQSDGGTFQFSKLNQLLQNRQFNVPLDSRLPGSNIILPNVLLGDEGYPLKPFLLRPYPQRTLTPQRHYFNKRLSSARTTVECTFGILAAKWRIFQKPIETNTKNACRIIKACCLLHNIIRDLDGNNDADYMNKITSPANHQSTRRSGSRSNATYSVRAKIIRDKFCLYLWENRS